MRARITADRKDIRFKDREIELSLVVLHSMSKPLDIYYENSALNEFGKKTEYSEAITKYTKLYSEDQLKTMDNNLMQEHQQHYRSLRIRNPEVRFKPFFIGPFMEKGVSMNFVFAIQKILAELDSSNAQEEWVLTFQHRDSMLLDVGRLKEKMKGRDWNMQQHVYVVNSSWVYAHKLWAIMNITPFLYHLNFKLKIFS